MAKPEKIELVAKFYISSLLPVFPPASLVEPRAAFSKAAAKLLKWGIAKQAPRTPCLAGVVRSIMRPSRGRDPGSNPGRGIKKQKQKHYSIKLARLITTVISTGRGIKKNRSKKHYNMNLDRLITQSDIAGRGIKKNRSKNITALSSHG